MNSPPNERKSPNESSFGHPGVHEAFDLDVLLRALAHPCRRAVLCLLDAEPEWTFEDLVSNLGTVETVPGATLGTDVQTTPGSDVEAAPRSYLGTVLYHQHLPLLAQARLIEGDEAYRRIRRGENFDDVRAMVDAAVEAVPLSE